MTQTTEPWTQEFTIPEPGVSDADALGLSGLSLVPGGQGPAWEVPSTAINSALGRLGPRFLGDALAVCMGVLLFEFLDKRISFAQIMVAIGFLSVAIVMDATHVRIEWNYIEEFVVSLKSGVVALALTATVGFLGQIELSRTLFLFLAGAMTVTKPLMAMVTDRFVRHETAASGVALVMCGDEEHQELLAAAAESSSRPIRWARLWDGEGELPSSGFVGRRQDLVTLCRELNPGKVVLGKSHALHGAFLHQVAAVNEMGIPVRSFARSFSEDFGRVSITSLDTSWFLFDIAPLHRMGYRVGRRVVDLLGGIVAGLLLLLMLPFLALAVKIDSPGPVFFTQVRVGQRGRLFTMYKVRTMRVVAEPDGPVFTQKNDHRVTRLGRLLRRSRMDELPQAINLLLGDMTLIGPRPERPEWVSRYQSAIPYYDKRHLLKPGLTGWAQVHEGYGSSESDTVRKLERDLYYLRNRSLGLDLRILMATAARVVRLAGQ